MVRKEFEDKAVLEAALTKEILEALQLSVEKKGKASVLFSGGSTPEGLLRGLAKSSLNWANVKVGLVDDRLVPANHEDSNSLMLHHSFLDLIEERKPYFFPLVFSENRDLNFELALSSVDKLGIPDVVILGMGNDGHFASLFPNDDASNQGLVELFASPLIYTRAPVEPKNRISHTWPYLRCAGRIFLHITGKAKLDVIDGSTVRSEELPIDHVLKDRAVKTEIFWAP
jgi:6-phosphogluconolactonase